MYDDIIFPKCETDHKNKLSVSVYNKMIPSCIDAPRSLKD